MSDRTERLPPVSPPRRSAGAGVALVCLAALASSAWTTTAFGGELDGVWQSECFDYGESDVGMLGGQFDQVTFTIRGERIGVATVEADDPDCSEVIDSIEFSGSLTTGSDVALDDGSVGTEFDVTMTEASHSISDPDEAAALAEEGFCGRGDWAVGDVVDLAKCAEEGAPLLPFTEYDVVQIRGDTLYLSGYGASSPEERPTSVDPEEAFVRIAP